jgi:hydrogenase maturation protein HypF
VSVGAPTAPESPRRVGARVLGTVQGVGFRPFVFRLAGELGLAGFVANDSRGVLLEVEGDPAAVEEFFSRLLAHAPPLARVERVVTERREPTGVCGFTILASAQGGAAETPVAPDMATCADCLAELLDPRDRRYRYPFTNCTNCGPRFTIVTGVPYDRTRTTMAAFAMCERCRAEYEDPRDRRFHAQPNACPDCGPTLRLLRVGGTGDAAAASGEELVSEPSAPAGGSDAAALAAAALRDGAIVAVKGLGGFHLACRADEERVVARLRERKHREEEPFALMAGDLAAAEELVLLGGRERALLQRPERPIVLARRRPAAGVAPSVARGAPELGVMLPYTPLHHLLMADAGVALVMTSGNAAHEPIAYEDDDALARLGSIADLILLHDRPIRTRNDDSVARVAGGRTTFLRRSRGYVPASIELAGGAPRPLLACGAELKSTFCLARGPRAWVSHHIGDLRNYETLRSFTEGIEHFEDLVSTRPQVVAHDLHPDYLSSRYAQERDDVELCPVQHHHAHLAACLAEHGESGPVLGAVFDGSGHGSDGTVWGGELLVGGLRDFERVGHLRTVGMPGGDAAVREPWRMACSWLLEAGADAGEPRLPEALLDEVGPASWETVSRMARSELAPLTSSVGRLFDAVAALCGVRARITYEGQAAIELEYAVDRRERGAYAIALELRDGVLQLDPRQALLQAFDERAAGVATGTIAARFHTGLANATARACERLASERGLDTVVLSGGVFHNRVLLARTTAELRRAGLRTLVPRLLPAGDGGISFGQAAVAAARLRES